MTGLGDNIAAKTCFFRGQLCGAYHNPAPAATRIVGFFLLYNIFSPTFSTLFEIFQQNIWRIKYSRYRPV